MSEPTIAPLAKQLAEENNVDWRVLQGSGADGSVVEKDVLTYLAKVMAGEESINPTAEPTPEGMEAWPEEDIKAFQAEQASSAEAASDPSQSEEEVSWGAFADADASAPEAPQVKEELDAISLEEPAPVASTPAPSSSGISSAEYQAALNEIERLKGEVQTLKSQQAQGAQSKEQVATLQSENAQLKGQVSKLQGEQSQAKSELERAKSAASGQGALKDENEKVKAKLEKAKAEISRQRGVLEKAKRQIDALTAQLEEASQKRPWWKLFG